LPVGIASNPEVVSAAFSDDVVEGGNNSEVLELSDGAVVVLRLESHEPAAQLPLDTVRDQIAQELKLRTAREEAMRTGETLLERLRTGELPEQVATSENARWSESTTLSRQSSEGDPGLRSLVFRMPKPEREARTYAGRSLPDGGFTIVALESVTPGTADGEEDRSEDLRRSMTTDHGSAAVEEYSRALRDKAEVAINQENLQGSL
jgi:peptidyl-prolyl cis-trans isomerase D